MELLVNLFILHGIDGADIMQTGTSQSWQTFTEKKRRRICHKKRTFVPLLIIKNGYFLLRQTNSTDIFRFNAHKSLNKHDAQTPK